MARDHRTERGPFEADHLRSGDAYELSWGHPIRLAPTSPEVARAKGNAYAIVSTDPLVKSAGVDPGFKLDDGTLRAPDVAILPEGAIRGWIPGAPSLAIEYAHEGQDEDELQVKIGELLAAGTRFLWIVRLIGPRRVEAYEEGVLRVAVPGDELAAPGLLQNVVPVSALFDPEEARALQLRNLLQRHGYRSIEEVSAAAFAEGRQEGLEQGRAAGRHEAHESVRLESARLLLETLVGRGLAIGPNERERIERAPLPTLLRWLVGAGAGAASSVEDLLRA